MKRKNKKKNYQFEMYITGFQLQERQLNSKWNMNERNVHVKDTFIDEE